MSLSAKALEEHKSGPFCILPFSQIVVDAFGDCYPCEAVRGITSFCMGNIKQQTISEIWNSKKIKKIRVDMINGVRNEICDKNCHGKRELTCKSLNHISRYKKVQKNLNSKVCLNSGFIDSYPNILLLKSSNICNLACRYCKKESSNSWADLEDKVNNIPKKSNTLVGIGKDEIKKIEENIDDVEELILFGGEPTIYKPHFELLEKIIDMKKNKNIRIIISTNFMQLGIENKNIFELINNFPNSVVWGSIDAYDDLNDYIRINSNFKKVENNVKYVFENCKNIKLYLNSVISTMNIFNIIDLHKSWYIKGLLKKDSIRYTILDSPSEYNILYFSDEMKLKIIKEYENYIKWLNEDEGLTDNYPNNFIAADIYLKENIINYIKTTHLDKADFIKVRKKQIEKFNKLNNFFEKIPRSANYLEEELNKKIIFVNKVPLSFTC